ncbi:hypothetical protein RMCBS344292_02178 [Rhizopus microsporus]|nr:hypothetical protein RMCBS344292_02178 [Rhizopus microsporus]
MSTENGFGIFLDQLMQLSNSNIYSEDDPDTFLQLTSDFQVYESGTVFHDSQEQLPSLSQDPPLDLEAATFDLTSSFSTSTCNSSVLTDHASYDPALPWTTGSPYTYFESLHNRRCLSPVTSFFESLTIGQASYMPDQLNNQQNGSKQPTSPLQHTRRQSALIPPKKRNLEETQSSKSIDRQATGIDQCVNSQSARTKAKSKPERLFPCSTCGRPFKRPQDRNRHQVSHTGEKRFFCSHPSCQNKGFTRKDALTRHMKCHENSDDNKTEKQSKTVKKAKCSISNREALLKK